MRRRSHGPPAIGSPPRGARTAEINTRKQLLNAKLRGIFVFKLIMQMIEQSENGEVPDEIILSQLALRFPHERPQRILRTVVAWARYAELLKYSGTRKVLYGLSPAPAARP